MKSFLLNPLLMLISETIENVVMEFRLNNPTVWWYLHI